MKKLKKRFWNWYQDKAGTIDQQFLHACFAPVYLNRPGPAGQAGFRQGQKAQINRALAQVKYV